MLSNKEYLGFAILFILLGLGFIALCTWVDRPSPIREEVAVCYDSYMELYPDEDTVWVEQQCIRRALDRR